MVWMYLEMRAGKHADVVAPDDVDIAADVGVAADVVSVAPVAEPQLSGARLDPMDSTSRFV